MPYNPLPSQCLSNLIATSNLRKTAKLVTCCIAGRDKMHICGDDKYLWVDELLSRPPYDLAAAEQIVHVNRSEADRAATIIARFASC